MVALGLARRQRAAKLRRLQKQELEKRATARLGAADGAVYVAAVSRFPAPGSPWAAARPGRRRARRARSPRRRRRRRRRSGPARGPRGSTLGPRRAAAAEIARSKAAGVLAAVVVVALGFHGAVARLRDAPHLAAPDDARFDAYGRYVAAEAPETARSAFSPSLLMVAGSRKSGATYVRQLLLDNLYVAPLDARDHDHHLEPAMAAAREAAGLTHHLTNDAGGAPGAAPSLQRRARLASSGLFVRKAYYLDRDYVADLGRNAHHAIRTHLDAAAEAALGLHDGVGDSRRDARRARRRKRHLVALLRTLDKLVMPVVGGCLALLLGVSAFVFWRLRGEEPASDGAAETRSRATRDELRWVTDRGARAVPAARKDVAAAAAPPVSSYAAMWGEPDFNTADDSTDSDEEEFDVLDDPSSESSDSDFYD
ncbi:hypothetical protein JL722_8671 [Aureococcus anophagefferens]|nr:hypothetical protein JL722_8671 [Aureococcus anophagefferens]